MQATNATVPKALSRWFIIHFVADITFALPLMIVPVQFLTIFGWQTVDPVAARIVAAALFGIGIESLLGRNSTPDSFKSMLNLKIIWSLATIIGVAWCLLSNVHGRPLGLWLIFAIFVAFNVLWVYWRVRIHKLLHP